MLRPIFAVVSAAIARTAVARVLRPSAALAAALLERLAGGLSQRLGAGLLAVVCSHLAAVSCEIRLVAWLGLVSGPSRRCAKESGFFDPLRPGQKPNHGFSLTSL